MEIALRAALVAFGIGLGVVALRSKPAGPVPLELVALLGFSILVIVGEALLPMVAPALSEDLVQYTGWGAATLWMFAGLLSVQLLRQPQARTRVILLGLLALFGVGHAVEFWVEGGSRVSDNPYLAVSPYQPIWTAAIPLFWAVVLLSPRVTRFSAAGPLARPA